MEDQPIPAQANAASSSSTSSSVPAPSKLPSIGALFKESWSLYKSRFSVLLKLSALLIASYILFLGTTFLSRGDTTALLLKLLNVLAYVLFMVFTFLSYAAMLYAVKMREETKIIKLLSQSAKVLIPLFWVGILGGILIAGGFFLFIIPGILLAIWFSVAEYVFIEEGRGGMYAQLKSKYLVSGNSFPVFIRWLILGILSAAVIYIPMLVAFWIVNTIFGKSAIMEFALNAGVQSLGIIVSSFVLVYGYALYKQLMHIKQNIPFAEPTVKRKVKYLAVGLGGLIAFLLLGILLVSFSGIAMQARDADRAVELRYLQIELEMFYFDNENYPTSLQDLRLNSSRLVDDKGVQYEYVSQDDGQWYSLCADFEVAETKQCVDPETSIGSSDDRNQ